MNYAIEQRLRLIDFLLEMYGHVGRPELMVFFGVSPAQATRDFRSYREKAPGNCVFDNNTQRYMKALDFKPLFCHEYQQC